MTLTVACVALAIHSIDSFDNFFFLGMRSKHFAHLTKDLVGVFATVKTGVPYWLSTLDFYHQHDTANIYLNGYGTGYAGSLL